MSKPDPNLTPEQWRHVAEQLASVYAPGIYILADGDMLTFSLRQVNATQLRVTVAVNGWIPGRWLLPDCAEPEARWFPLRSRKLFPGLRARLERKHGARRVAALAKDLRLIDADRRFEYRDLCFRSAAEVRRHLERTAASLELLDGSRALELISARRDEPPAT